MENKKKDIPIRRILLVLGVLLISVAMIFTVSHSINRTMEENQLRMLDVVAERITENMSGYFGEQWNWLDFIEKNFRGRSYETTEDVLEYLRVEKDAVGLIDSDSMLLLVDSSGFYYSIDRGLIAPWTSANTVFAPNGIEAKRTVSINALKELEGKTLNEYLCFWKKMDSPVKTEDGTRFTHIIMAADKEIFNIELSLSEFGRITDAFVMDSLGRKINAQNLATDLAKTYNLMRAIERAEFRLGRSYREMMQDLRNFQGGCSLVDYEGVNYYISYKYMGVEDWYSVFLVDEKDMISDVKPLAYNLIVQLTVGFTLLVLLAAGFLVISTRESMKREREIQRKLTEAAEVADKANQAKSVFLSRMSHDIRTPINGIIGMTNIAKATIDDKESVQDCLKKIESSSEHLFELVNEVLEITRIESGKTELHPEQMNLVEVLKKMGDIIESKLLDKSLDYEINFDGVNHPYICADENIIKQVLLNLLGNSVKYTPDGGQLKCIAYDVRNGENTAEYHFIVQDTGIGMKKEFLEHIFDRFSQEKISARTTYEGTGLGMAITKEFVDLMNGQILVESEVGKGSRFEVIVTFQFYDKVEIAEKPKVMEKKERSYHVLVAEDNEINRTIIQFILMENGSTCELVGNGKELVERFENSKQGEFDAIMTDIRMPVLNGLEAARSIRTMDRPDAVTIPIFAMTANAYRRDEEESLAAGMNAHLTKPLEAEKIMAVLHEFCI